MTLCIIELQLRQIQVPLLIIKLVVEALNVARAHVLAVQLLDLELVCVTNCIDFKT